jgi:hypothetical protein
VIEVPHLVDIECYGLPQYRCISYSIQSRALTVRADSDEREDGQAGKKLRSLNARLRTMVSIELRVYAAACFLAGFSCDLTAGCAEGFFAAFALSRPANSRFTFAVMASASTL